MQLFTLPLNAHAHNITTQKLLLRKSYESFGSEIIKKLRRFSIMSQRDFFQTCMSKLTHLYLTLAALGLLPCTPLHCLQMCL